jgi:tetratricopeptide (TPR) repeat protein
MRHFRSPALLVVLGVSLTRQSPADTPVPLDTLFDRGVQALKAGRLEEAETVFRRVLQQGGNRAYVHNNLAIVYQEQAKHAEAVAECREAIRLDPGYAPPRVVLGGSLLALGRVAEATTELQRALKLLPKERLVREQLARAYTRGGNPAAAIEQYRVLREMAPDEPEYAYQLGRAYLRLSEWAMQRLREIDPGSARIYQALGHSYRVQGRADLAARAFERAAQADPKLPEIHLALAQIHLEQKSYGEARKEIDRELAIVPESAGARALKQRLEAVEGR